ncbi:MAG: PBSX family phage terminase large subunit [Gammaproteobacteria bacterium]|nr:PBSX family phage terminase large subunit [Gammaproteobacteria bacterium]
MQIPDSFKFLFDPPLGSVRYRMTKGGRGSAKSHSKARALLTHAMNIPNLRVGCYRELQRSIATSSKQLLDDVIREEQWEGFFKSTKTEIYGINGSNFLFGGLRHNIDSIRSTEGVNVAWITEAAKVSQGSWDVLRPTIRTPVPNMPFAEIWGDWNPDLPTDPVDAMFFGPAGPPPDSICRVINWRDNPFFPETLKSDLEFDKSRDKDKYNWVWEGFYRKNSMARVFNNWTEEEFEAPPNAVFRLGADFGHSLEITGDPSVLIRCYIDGFNLYIDYEAYGHGINIRDLPQLFEAVPDARKWLITADTSRPETIRYLQGERFKVVPAVKGARSVEEGVEFLKNYNIFVHPRCVATIRELNAYSYKIDPVTEQVLPILEDTNNHVIDALRYAIEGVRLSGRAKVDPVKQTKIIQVPTGWMR